MEDLELEQAEAEAVEQELPDDFAAYQAARDAQRSGTPVQEAPAPGEEETAPSEPADEAGQTAAESDTEEEAQQEEEEPAQPKRSSRLGKRMRELTGEIAGLKAQLAALQEGEPGEENPEEAASSPEPEVEQAPAPLVRPKLADFEDTDAQTAWEQYEAAMDAYHDAKQASVVQRALDKQARELSQKEQERANIQAQKAAADAWNKAASRFADYNEVVNNPDVKISGAMEVVMKRDPEMGTAIAMYLGKNPKESLRIAEATIAGSPAEYPAVIARAGLELGKILAKIEAAPAAPSSQAPKPAAKPPLKTVSTAGKPPAQIRPKGAPQKTDILSDEDAGDYAKWVTERNRQLAANGKR